MNKSNTVFDFMDALGFSYDQETECFIYPSTEQTISKVAMDESWSRITKDKKDMKRINTIIANREKEVAKEILRKLLND